MATKTLSSWEIITADSHTANVMAENIQAACALVEGDSDAKKVHSARFLKGNILCDIPEADVHFSTKVAYTNTEDGSGCEAYPGTFVVKANSKVIFSAVAAEGYTFVNWTRNDVEVSTDATAEIEVTPLTSSELLAEYVANFAQD